jgi:hydroxymethylpyrimidine pyrophosphatase-like HAD family hydrolase
VRYHALAADYDGTLAHHGLIDDLTWASLRALRESGRKLIMVTGRELDELLKLLPHPEMFDRIVAENGAVLYSPATKAIRLLAATPPPEFAIELARRGVDRVAVGRVIVAAWEPHQDTILHAIHDMELELQVIFNKGAVMVLPTGVNKATGLEAALHDLGLSRHNVIGIGDAENDHALIRTCEVGVAVSNALPGLKAKADLVVSKDHGAGVAELIEQIVDDDLNDIAPPRHRVLIGRAGEREIHLDPYTSNIMVCGTSGSGKSTLTTGLLERLCDRGYQFAILDPEGDYSSLEFAVVLGGAGRAPLVEEVVDVLRDSTRNAVVNMLGVAVDHRPEFFGKLLPALAELRQRTGRPHWLVVDEAHHLLPENWQPAAELTLRPHGTLYVTVHPGSVAEPVIDSINTLLVVGDHPDKTLEEFCKVAGHKKPRHVSGDKLAPGYTLYWRTDTKETCVVEAEKCQSERVRHSRKYVEGNLGHHSFVFRGPSGKLKLKAHNLQLFVLIADGIDDDTWTFHLRNGEYSQWFRRDVKDPDLAQAARVIELDIDLDAAASRERIRREIETRYTLPADEPSGIVDDDDDDPVEAPPPAAAGTSSARSTRPSA